MLDLVFLVLMLIALIYAMRGEFRETLCNVAAVIGVVAALIGIISAFINTSSTNGAPLALNIFLLILAVLLRRFAKQFVKLYEEKERENAEKLLAETSRYARDNEKALPPVYTEDNFDDPELRFGKGGYTDNDL